MNKKEILFTHAGKSLDSLPQELQDQLKQDSRLRGELIQQARVASLLRLKQYEVPDEAMEGRVLHRVGVRIRNGEHLSTARELEFIPGWARMVAVVVVMLGLSVLTHREMLQNNLVGDLQSAGLQEDPLPAVNSLPVPRQLHDPFSPVYVVFDNQETPNLLTPEFAEQLEISFAELGLDVTNRVEASAFAPVSFAPAP